VIYDIRHVTSYSYDEPGRFRALHRCGWSPGVATDNNCFATPSNRIQAKTGGTPGTHDFFGNHTEKRSDRSPASYTFASITDPGGSVSRRAWTAPRQVGMESVSGTGI